MTGEDLSVLIVFCPLVITRGVPGKTTLSYMQSVLGYPKSIARRRPVCPSCRLSSGYPKRGGGVPREDLSVLHVVCPLATPRI